jgi:hypothetical protein
MRSDAPVPEHKSTARSGHTPAGGNPTTTSSLALPAGTVDYRHTGGDSPAGRPRVDRRILPLISFEAFTLAVFSALHFSGALHIGSQHDASRGAGIAEAAICLALVLALAALMRCPANGRKAAMIGLTFAIFGFIVGLTFTIRGGNQIDLGYHATMLPVLIATCALLARSGHSPAADYQPDRAAGSQHL